MRLVSINGIVQWKSHTCSKSLKEYYKYNKFIDKGTQKCHAIKNIDKYNYFKKKSTVTCFLIGLWSTTDSE